MDTLLKLLTLSALLFVLAQAQAQAQKPIIFSPLPTKNVNELAEDYLPLIDHLEAELNHAFKYNLKSDYNEIIIDITSAKTDLFVLGPLPYLILKKQFPDVKPLFLFKRANGSAKYKCVLSKFKPDKFENLTSLRVALTQPMSTCGYYQGQHLFFDTFSSNLNDHKYSYMGSHANAIESVIKGEHDIASTSDRFAANYANLGIEVIQTSQELPGFGLFVNTKTLEPKTIQKIQRVLSTLSSEDFQQIGGIAKFGLLETTHKAFKNLSIPDVIPNNGNWSP